jgi:hypothetical protein
MNGLSIGFIIGVGIWSIRYLPGHLYNSASVLLPNFYSGVKGAVIEGVSGTKKAVIDSITPGFLKKST